MTRSWRQERAGHAQTSSFTVIEGYEYAFRDTAGNWTEWMPLHVKSDGEAETFKRCAWSEVKWRHAEVEVTADFGHGEIQDHEERLEMHHDCVRSTNWGPAFAAVHGNIAAYFEQQQRLAERNRTGPRQRRSENDLPALT